MCIRDRISLTLNVLPSHSFIDRLDTNFGTVMHDPTWYPDLSPSIACRKRCTISTLELSNASSFPQRNGDPSTATSLSHKKTSPGVASSEAPPANPAEIIISGLNRSAVKRALSCERSLPIPPSEITTSGTCIDWYIRNPLSCSVTWNRPLFRYPDNSSLNAATIASNFYASDSAERPSLLPRRNFAPRLL